MRGLGILQNGISQDGFNRDKAAIVAALSETPVTYSELASSIRDVRDKMFLHQALTQLRREGRARTVCRRVPGGSFLMEYFYVGPVKSDEWVVKWREGFLVPRVSAAVVSSGAVSGAVVAPESPAVSVAT